MADSQEILTFALDMGETLLRSGGEIYRVEDTVTHVLDAFGMKRYDVYVLSNGIFASASTESGEACGMIRQVPLSEMHLGKIAAINQLSREICEHMHDMESAKKRLMECRSIPAYNPRAQSVACGIGCACFAYLFGGTLFDAFIVFVLGICLQAFRLKQQEKNTSKFIINIIGSAFLTGASLLTLHFNWPVMQDKIVIGGIMPLVPGIALTTSIRDFFNGDFLSGAIHLLDALLTGMSIAVGVGFVMTAYQFVRGGPFP